MFVSSMNEVSLLPRKSTKDKWDWFSNSWTWSLNLIWDRVERARLIFMWRREGCILPGIPLSWNLLSQRAKEFLWRWIKLQRLRVVGECRANWEHACLLSVMDSPVSSAQCQNIPDGGSQSWQFQVNNDPKSICRAIINSFTVWLVQSTHVIGHRAVAQWSTVVVVCRLRKRAGSKVFFYLFMTP